MITPPPDAALREAVEYAAGQFARHRDTERCGLNEGLAWKELVACIVGGATRYEHALNASKSIYSFLPEPWVTTAEDWQQLREDMETGTIRLPTQFPREHGRYILAAVDTLYVRGEGLFRSLLSGLQPMAMRRHLVHQLRGIGPKQASLLLLNLGVTDDLAVLDRHVLRYMTWIEAIDSDRPPRTIRDYEAAETKFRAHAQALGHTVADLDRAVWLTSRVWGEMCT